MKLRYGITWFVLIQIGAAHADSAVVLTTDTDKINYSIGYQIGGDFKRQQVELRSDAIVRGIEDALRGGEPLLGADEMRAKLVDLKKKIVADQQDKKQQSAHRLREEGAQYMAANAAKPGVVTLQSGLQYQVLAQGTGKSPGPHDKVTVHYRGTLIDGKEFDSSFRNDKPLSLPVDAVIPGWTQALQLMKEGDKWQLVIPPDLAYGERGPLADRTLVFDVELLAVN